MILCSTVQETLSNLHRQRINTVNTITWYVMHPEANKKLVESAGMAATPTTGKVNDQSSCSADNLSTRSESEFAHMTMKKQGAN